MSDAPKLVGIVNLTEDSFSDGGLYLAPDAALAHARALVRHGADIVDLGAAASNPSAKAVPAETEIARLAPLVDALKHDGIRISIDAFALATQRWALQRGVEYLNDVHGFAHPELYPQLAGSEAKLIVMHALRSEGPAGRKDETPPHLFERIIAFFEARIEVLSAAGIARNRFVLDPGMGLFLGCSRDASFEVLRRIAELKSIFRLPVLISVSRKSFLRIGSERSAREAGAATLAAELFAVEQGVDYVRTHDPGALRDGLSVMAALRGGKTAGAQDLRSTRREPLVR